MIHKAALTHLTRPMALLRFNEARQRPGAVVEMIEQDDGLWTVSIVWDDDQALSFQDLEAFDETAVATPGAAPLHAAAAPAGVVGVGAGAAAPLGQLSQKFESNGRPGAIGFDTKGGFSYGTYQIATRTGTMDKFLAFLAQGFPDFSQKLAAAGGAAAALAGSEAFKAAWIALAANPAFADAQHAYIAASHYQPFAKRLRNTPALDLDLDSRSAVLRDVAWSVAVQHGPGNQVFDAALRNQDTGALTDAQIIPLIYGERAKVNRYFPSSTAQVKAALVARFQEELALAMSRLA